MQMVNIALLPKATMVAWQAHNGTTVHLTQIASPKITKPDQVLIKVKAASLNYIDTTIVKPYANDLMTCYKRFKERNRAVEHFPIVAGRDCSGVVVAVGDDVDEVQVGDEVMALIPMWMAGSHAEYVLTRWMYVVRKPRNVSFVEAAGLPYVFSACWEIFVNVAGINPKNPTSWRNKKKILIHGGGGGVGTMAMMLLRTWGVNEIYVTCSARKFDHVRQFGGIPIDYEYNKIEDGLQAHAPYDIIVDLTDTPVTLWSDRLMRRTFCSKHICVTDSLMRITNKKGICKGIYLFCYGILKKKLTAKIHGGSYIQTCQKPNRKILLKLVDYVESEKIHPVVDTVFPFNEASNAYAKVSSCHGSGKTIVQM